MPVNTLIRMYNLQDLGDCFLLKFERDNGHVFFLMIDFGSYQKSNANREREIAADIIREVGDHPLTIVLTHQHKDHLTGFQRAGDILEPCATELWLSFLDNEKSEAGKQLRSQTEKYWRKSEKIAKLADEQFGVSARVKEMLKAKQTFDLFGEKQTSGEALSALLKIVKNKVRFLTPGDSFFLPGMEDEVKVYVLGPPLDAKQLRKLDPNKDNEVTGLNFEFEMAATEMSSTLMLKALEDLDPKKNASWSCSFPFSNTYIQSNDDVYTKKIYEDPSEQYRRIDEEWLSEIGGMALHMDNLTNNSSLVLAFELVRTKQVLLFVGDAQAGNWKSWGNVKFSDDPGIVSNDLLSRTVVYKAGHHSSGNATMLDGLNLMNEEELIIIIPVDGEVSKKQGFDMLKTGMLTGYNRKSQGRVFRSDEVELNGNGYKTAFPFKTRADMQDKVAVRPDSNGSHLSVDISINQTAETDMRSRKIEMIQKAISQPVSTGATRAKAELKPSKRRKPRLSQDNDEKG